MGSDPWAVWDVDLELAATEPHYVLGGTLVEANLWVSNKAGGSLKYKVVKDVPVGVHGGTLWLVGNAANLRYYNSIVRIARAAGMQVLAG